MATYDQPIIIKKVKKSGHAAHHGGAWKIAYADFVTAMMAFFLLLWLISMTTPEQKKGLADYFAPASLSETTSGAGGVLAGNAFETQGAKTTDAASELNPGVAESRTNGMATLNDGSGQLGTASGNDPTKNALEKPIQSNFRGAFEGAAASIRQAWQQNPNLTDVQDSLRVEETADGLDIQIMDAVGRPMFPEGSKYPFEYTRQAIASIAPILAKGHPLILVGEGDIGGLVGMHCQQDTGIAKVVSIDGIKLDEFDFIDIGAILETSGAVPVVIKSLVFPSLGLGHEAFEKQ